MEWIFDMDSNKNSIKWAVTTPFNLRVIKRIPSSLKYTILAVVPLLVGILVKLIRYLRARAAR